MTRQNRHSLALEGVPDVDRVVVVPGEQEPSADAQVDGVGPEDNAFLGIDRDLFVGAEIKQTAGRIIRARCHGVAARVKANLKRDERKFYDYFKNLGFFEVRCTEFVSFR